MKGQGRSWKLKRMTMDSDDAMQLKKGQQAQADRRHQDLERFMQVSISIFSAKQASFSTTSSPKCEITRVLPLGAAGKHSLCLHTLVGMPTREGLAVIWWF